MRIQVIAINSEFRIDFELQWTKRYK